MLMPPCLLTALFACTVGASATAQTPPKLIVAISVDQLSTQLFRAYRPHFTGGLKRMADGVAYANGFQAHGNTETCPGHATLLTGAHPTRSGIVANGWIDFDAARADKTIYCAEDERAPGSSSDDYAVSAVHLRAATLGDRMKAADPRSRVVAVAGKDRSAVMMGGRAIDQLWWGSPEGSFVGRGTPQPAPVVARLNATIAATLAKPRPPLAIPPVCTPKNRAIPVGARTVGTHRFDRAAGEAEAFQSSPEYDAAVLALAAALAQEMQLGQGPATDLLAIGLSATDLVGHAYGTDGLEMCLQLLTMDRDLGAFFDVLDRMQIAYAVVLSADHGGLDLPERARLQGSPAAARMDPALRPAAIGQRIAAELGLADPAFAGDWYLTPAVPDARRTETLALAHKLLTTHSQVEAVYRAEEVAAHPIPTQPPERWSLLDRLRASYDPTRSGDLLVVLKEFVTLISAPAGGSVATHGSPWDHDRKVPILFWWRGIVAEDREASAMTVDIAPTLAGLIGVSMPAAELDGRCLDIIAGAGSNCR